MTSDTAAAGDFYGRLFGWTIEAMNTGMPYHVVKVGESAIGGIMGKPPNAPAGMPPVWMPYVTVADVDAMVKEVESLGGKVHLAPQDIPSVGRFAVIADPQGAVLNIITYAAPAQ